MAQFFEFYRVRFVAANEPQVVVLPDLDSAVELVVALSKASIEANVERVQSVRAA